MKILLVSTAPDGSRQAVGGADSALLRPGEPIFSDTDASARSLSVALAVRISKLGLHIPEKHASRHYDAVAAVVLHLPSICDGIPPLFHDRAVSPGQWIDVAEISGSIALAASRRPLPGRSSEEIDLSDEIAPDIDATVAWLSQTMTFKTGDIIIFADTVLGFGTPLPDTSLTATVAGHESLSVRIK